MTICTNFQTPFKTRLYIKVEENWPSSFREEDISRLNDFIHVYSPEERADNPGGGGWGGGGEAKLFIVTERVLRKSCFNILPIQINAQVGKFDLAVKRSIVSLGSSFEQT